MDKMLDALASREKEREEAFAALWTAEETYRTVIEQTGQLIYDYDIGTGRIRWGGAIQEITGAPPDEFQDTDIQKWEELIHPDDRKQAVDLLEIAKEQGVRYDVTYRFRKKDGSYAFMTDRGVFLTDQAGRPHRMLGVMNDVTPLKKSEEALKKSEKRFREIFDNVSLLGVVLDREGRVLLVNANFLEVLGYERDEVVGKNWWNEFIPPEYRDKVKDRFLALRTDADVPTQVDGQCLTKRGERLFIRWTHTALWDPKGDLESVACLGLDLTEAKKAEAERRLLLSAINHAQEGIAVSRPDGIIIYANRFFESLKSLPSLQIRDVDERTMSLGADQEGLGNIFFTCVRTNQVVSRRVEVQEDENSARYFDVVASPLLGAEGRVEAVIGSIRDVTQEVLLQEQFNQAQKMEAIGALAGGIAHDFNNLLQVILGYSEMLMMKHRSQQKLASDLERISIAGRKGTELVKSLLAFSRKNKVELSTVALNEEIQQNKLLLERTMPKDIVIDVRLEENLAPISADANQISQVLLNLAINARDAMPQGGKLTISTANVLLDEAWVRHRPHMKPGQHVLLSVSDTGIGMDKQTASRIFEPFFTTKEPGKGTGLGLATVYGIIRQHGGHIECETAPGLGTTFKIFLPAVEDASLKKGREGENDIFSGRGTLLFVDDDQFLRDLVCEVLGKAGYTVLTAGDGIEALNMIQAKSRQIDAVILDLMMPNMGGKQCLQEMKKLRPSLKIIVASGYVSDEIKEEVLALGAEEFVPKPYDFHRLCVVINRVLSAQEASSSS
jgi:PAS domain S-box-containing protein